MREGDRGKDYRLRQERRRLENREKDLIIYKGEITTKQALQQETGTEVSDIQPQTRNQGQGRDYHQTSATSPNTVSTNQTTKLSHSPTTPNPRRDTPGEKWVGERGQQREGKHYSERYTDLCSDKCQKFM